MLYIAHSTMSEHGTLQYLCSLISLPMVDLSLPIVAAIAVCVEPLPIPTSMILLSSIVRCLFFAIDMFPSFLLPTVFLLSISRRGKSRTPSARLNASRSSCMTYCNFFMLVLHLSLHFRVINNGSVFLYIMCTIRV